MMYRVYLRWPNQRVSDKTATQDKHEADQAFHALLARSDMIGKKAAAVMSFDNQQLKYHRFDRTKEHQDA